MGDTSAFHQRVVKRIREIAKGKGMPSSDELSKVLSEEVAREGGFAKSAKAKEKAAEKAESVAASEAGLAELSVDDIYQLVHQALSELGVRASLVTWYYGGDNDRVVYATGGGHYGPDDVWVNEPLVMYERGLTITDGKAELGEQATEVRRVTAYEPVVAAEDSTEMFTVVDVAALWDSSGNLTPWIQVHKIGSWAVDHATAGKIMLDRAKGDQMITNFKQRVLRRDVPLDEGHPDVDGSKALGWVDDLRWGSEGQGKVGSAEPDGIGPILYAKIRYNALGQATLDDEQFRYVSPKYDRAYRDKESGSEYGWVLKGIGAVNDPYLRLRTFKGEECPQPALLSDGIQQGGTDMGVQGTPPAQQQNTEPTLAELMARITALEAQNTSLAERAAQAEQVSLQDRALRYSGEVATQTVQAIRDGVPPAVANTWKQIKLSLGAPTPATQQTVALDDAKPDEKVALHDALDVLLRSARMVPFGSLTAYPETRPGNVTSALSDPTVAASDEDVRAAAMQMRQEAGLYVPPATQAVTPPSTTGVPLSDQPGSVTRYAGESEHSI